MIPYGRQDISQSDIDAVIETLRGDWLTQGPAVPAFERDVGRYCQASYAVAANSGTSALHLAYLAADLGPGDRLWTTPITFVATANAARYCGAVVDFVDIDPVTGNMDPAALERKLAHAKQEGTLPKVVTPVHFAGLSCAMKPIAELASQYGFCIVEDACHALGGRYESDPVGCCTYSDMTVFSFHPVKIATTGEGGMVMTQREELRQRMVQLCSHGITKVREQMTGDHHGPWYYQQHELGFNYRLTDLQAALGSSQLKRLDYFISERIKRAKIYDRELTSLPLTLPGRLDSAQSAWHIYVIRLRPDQTKVTRLALFKQLREAGIGVNVHYIPVHTQPDYRRLGFQDGDFPEAERFYAQAITLPLYPTLSEVDQNHVIKSLRRALS
ncbi:MAG: UDP-4-amino-4,6-dideoxy-N-acetyl-beta-L-altrosamine transaminase [Magnetococcales bacterium]|nr:UDP-4-amino-4,6-dideoxy-N-acetyl-beta-L-altrosamine transaminase [Magnetococcales bacterium]